MLIANFTCQCGQQNHYEDTVWVRKIPNIFDLYMVKFSNNDSLIVCHGFGVDIFYETKTGKEIIRISGDEEIFCYNDDMNFIRLNEERTCFEIFDSKSYKVIDSLESDGTIINEYPIIDISKDGKYLIAPISKGFRIWDVSSKKILKTKIFPDEPNMIDVGVNNLRFVCGNEKIIAQFGKIYQNPDDPGNPITIGNFTVWDFYSLDSIDSFTNSRGFKLSNTCKYIAYRVSDADSGIVIYDFLKKEIVQKLAINGYSLTGLEFSSDDNYLVTSSGPGTNSLLIWEINSGKEVHRYWPSSYECIDVSNNGLYVLGNVGNIMRLFKSRFETSTVPLKEEIKKIIYPNPSNNIAIIEFELKVSSNTTIDLINLDGLLLKTFLNKFLESGQHNIEINTSDIPSGSYFLLVQNEQEKFVFQLIINH